MLDIGLHTSSLNRLTRERERESYLKGPVCCAIQQRIYQNKSKVLIKFLGALCGDCKSHSVAKPHRTEVLTQSSQANCKVFVEESMTQRLQNVARPVYTTLNSCRRRRVRIDLNISKRPDSRLQTNFVYKIWSGRHLPASMFWWSKRTFYDSK